MEAAARPIRALLVDDEPAARRRMTMLLSEDPEIDVVDQCGDGESMVERIVELSPDLVFLDVQMPEVTGFDALALVPPPLMPCVIFVTAYDRYAVRAFESHAIDFLVKPYSHERFAKACARAKSTIRAQLVAASAERILDMLESMSKRLPSEADDGFGGGRRFAVRSRGRITLIDEQEVLWISAARDYVRLHTADGSYLMRNTMSELERALDARRFVRIHRSTIVRAEAISHIRVDDNGRSFVVLPGDAERIISRAGKARLEEALGFVL